MGKKNEKIEITTHIIITITIVDWAAMPAECSRESSSVLKTEAEEVKKLTRLFSLSKFLKSHLNMRGKYFVFEAA